MRRFWKGLLALASIITLNCRWNRDINIFFVSLFSKPFTSRIVLLEHGEPARNAVNYSTDIPPVFLKSSIDQDFIFLISAFVDYRFQLFNASEPLRVTVNAMVNKQRFVNSRRKGLFCIFRVKFENNFKTFSSRASVHLFDDDHGRPYNSAIVECILPKELHLPQQVQVSIGNRNMLKRLNDMSWLKLIFNSRSMSVVKNTALVHLMNHSAVVCVPPIRGDKYKDSIVEWIEFYRIIGVSHFLLYDLSIGKQTLEILKLYEKKGIVSIFPWKIPSCQEIYHMENTSKESFARFSCSDGKFWVHYFGQRGAGQDCLHRAVGYSQWIGFLDIDEYMLPRTPSLFTLPELFLNKSSQLAYMSNSTEESLVLSIPGFHFQNQFAFAKCKSSVNLERFSADNNLLKRRNNLISVSTFLFKEEISPYWRRNKVFINPFVIKVSGIHVPDSIFEGFSFPSYGWLIDKSASRQFKRKSFLRYFIYLSPEEAIMRHIRRHNKALPACSPDLALQTEVKLVNDSTMLDKYDRFLIRRVVNFYEQSSIQSS